MEINDLINEIKRVEHILDSSTNEHTIKQNKKYLKRLRKDYYRRKNK